MMLSGNEDTKKIWWYSIKYHKDPKLVEKTWCSHIFYSPTQLCTLSPIWANPHHSSIQNPPADANPWLLKKAELPGCWQMHRYYIYSEYFVSKLTTTSLYQKSLINNITLSTTIGCIGVSTPLPPPNNTTPSFSPSPPLYLQTVQAPPFLDNPPLYIGFSWPPLKFGFLSEPP